MLHRYRTYVMEEAQVETEMEKASQEEEKKLLQQQIQYFNSNKGKLDALLKNDRGEELSVKVIGKNSLLATYWQIIKGEQRVEKCLEKSKILKDQLGVERSKLADEDSREAAQAAIKQINLEVKQLDSEKKELEIVGKSLAKQLQEKLALLKKKISIG